MTTIRRASTLTGLGLVVLLGIATTAAASSDVIEPRPSSLEQVPTVGSDEEALTLPVINEDMHDLATTLTEEFADDPNFASAEVSRDRSELIVHWWGEPTPALLERLAAAPTVKSIVERTAHQPGVLRDLARTLISEHSEVSYAVAKHDGSGLEVGAIASSGTQRRGQPTFLDGIDVPVELKADGVVAANSRQTDSGYRLGGARISLFEDPFIKSHCTSGFHVVKQGDPSKEGMMFAAHCGAVGSQWIVSNGTLAYSWGPVISRTTAYDGAIIDSGWSQPYMWASTWDSSVYTQINGSATPYVGQELCYSGSFSGLICGNIVQQINYLYNLGGDLTSVSGFSTVQNANSPAAGKGDSGGPGYQLVSTSSGLKRYAVGIISAIPMNSPAVCNGVPGSVGGRVCNPTVISTSVVQIGGATGWYVPVA